jgi:peptidoglycan/xylan/chitin deacetylase (PgdA/CDA1 family)
VVEAVFGETAVRFILVIAARWRLVKRSDQSFRFSVAIKRKWLTYQVLLYHRVNDDADPFFAGLPTRIFARQMELLRRYFTVLPLHELVQRAQENEIPPHAVAITFDDGYRDNYRYAYPVLKHLDLPATIFLATGAIDSDTPLWHDVVFNAFRRTTAKSILVGDKNYSLNTVAEKVRVSQRFLDILRTCSPKDRSNLITWLTRTLMVGDQRIHGADKLRWYEIVEMAGNNISFGAHTVSHSILSQMPLARAAEEIAISKKDIESHMNDQITLFAYPNGREHDFNDDIKDAVKAAGFLSAVTTIWGNNTVDTDPYELRRVQNWGENPTLSLVRLGYYQLTT